MALKYTREVFIGCLILAKLEGVAQLSREDSAQQLEKVVVTAFGQQS